DDIELRTLHPKYAVRIAPMPFSGHFVFSRENFRFLFLFRKRLKRRGGLAFFTLGLYTGPVPRCSGKVIFGTSLPINFSIPANLRDDWSLIKVMAVPVRSA